MNNHLFPALRDVGNRIGATPHLLLGLDFDGTLAPLEDDPAAVLLPIPTKQVLETLAGYRGVTLAFVSGRTLADVQERVSVTGAIYVGNHGLEIAGPGFRFVEPTAVEYSSHLQKLATQLGQQLGHINGVIVEDKGLSVSVHHRCVADTDVEVVSRMVLAAVEHAREHVHLTRGNKVYELRPRVPWHKGTAMHWVQQRLAQPRSMTIYVGDDITDEEAFAVLPDAVTIKVGEPEKSAAKYGLHDPAEVANFLGWTASLVRARDGHR